MWSTARTTAPHITSVPGKDIEAGLVQVLRSFPVERSRIGVSGWSEGGLMTSWLITHANWRAAVSGAAVNDWIGYNAMTDAQDFTKIFMGGSPWTSPSSYALFRDESPLTYAANVRTPTLIMSDAGDQRVPTPMAYEFYHEVRATGTPAQFVIYPVEPPALQRLHGEQCASKQPVVAVEIQVETGSEGPLCVRAGLNTGEVIAEDGDYFGSAVILAARIASLARGGEVLLSEATKSVAGSTRIPLVDRGEHRLRGLREPCRLYEAVWSEAD